jgi:branched-chain amino acid transport system permease protein
MINIYIILALSANLLIGVTNLLSIGQAAFYGIGAYLSAYFLIQWHLPLIPTILVVALITGLSSFIIAYPTLRFKGDYFILGTLGFQLIVYSILYNWISVTRGPYGIPGIPSPKLFGIWEINGIIGFLILSSVLAGLTIRIFYLLIHSPFGRNLKGIRDDEISVEVLGKNIVALKIWSFFISAAFSGVAGFLYASYVTYIDPTSFNLDEAIFIITAVLIGGSGNVRGSVLGAVFVIVLPELLRFVGLPDSVAANMRQIIFGLILIFLMRYRPYGIVGERKLT